MKNWLIQIREDMSVRDREGTKIGTVKDIQYGDEDLAQPSVETATAQKPEVPGNELVEDMAHALHPTDQIPSELQKRLQRYGYIVVNTGALAADRYVLADQIAEVSDDRVTLNATLKDLYAI